MDRCSGFLVENMNVLRIFASGANSGEEERDWSGVDCSIRFFSSYAAAIPALMGDIPQVIFCDYVPADQDFEQIFKSIRDLRKTKYVAIFYCLPVNSDPLEKKDKDMLKCADGVLNNPIGAQTANSVISFCGRLKDNSYKLDYTEKKLDKAMGYLEKFKQKLSGVKREAEEEKQMLHNSLKQISLMTRDRESREQEVKDQVSGARENIDRVVELLSELIEGKKNYHRGHSPRVAEIAVFIAGKFNLEENEILDIRRAALLHEVGKLSIPEQLALKRPDQYLAHEANLLSQHPVKGASIIKGFIGLEKVAGIVGSIHEHVDGGGLPRGVKKNRIPLGARIISVANVYENLMYRSDLTSTAEVLSSIEGETGVKYDAAIMFPLAGYVFENPSGGDSDLEKVGIYELTPGQTLGSGIYTSGGAKLLPAGIELTDVSIARISEYHKMDPLKEVVFIKK